MAEPVDKILSHSDVAIGRLVSQFRGKPNIEDFLKILLEPVQRLENAIYQVITETDIDNGVGAQLDLIGKVLKESRGGKQDEVYRRYLRAKIRTIRSDGLLSDLLTITELVIDNDLASFVVEPGYPAGLMIRIEDIDVDVSVAADLIGFLRKAVSAGVKLVLTYWTATSADMFRFARAAFTTASFGTGSTSIPVGSTSGFPNSGTLDVDFGLAVYEQITYTSITATSFEGISAPANSHDQGAVIQLAGGKGFGSDANPNLGGKFAGAKE